MKFLSERNIIAGIARQQTKSSVDVVKGIGDDCAVVAKNRGQVSLWTTDTLVEGVHFDLGWHPPALLGRKAAAVNISDIAAMGGRPFFALLSLGLPSACKQDFVDEFSKGFLDMLAAHGITLVGGDTVSSGERFMVSVTVCGEMAQDNLCLREHARPGDLVWVSGTLGDAACGLELCRKGLQAESPFLCSAHLDPQPQVTLGAALAESGLIHAMMDLSDGLATDLAHICKASGVAAEITGEQVPLSEELHKIAARLGHEPLTLALQGGEDYQLVFTAPEKNSTPLQALARQEASRITCLGRIVAGEGVVLVRDKERQDIGFRGYEHRF